MDDLQERLRQLPSVDSLLQTEQAQAWRAAYGHELALSAVRAALEHSREGIMAGGPAPSLEQVAAAAEAWLHDTVAPSLRSVINATGVILHTNLGRSPLSEEVLAAIREAGEGYSNLEFDLPAGRRGSRYVHAEDLLCRLTGAEAALLVNNNAGAVLLALSALAKGREVIISRSQLIEIGGGFRIPEVLAQSGAHLIEVGTTNRSYVDDYRARIGEQTVALMRAHHSNYRLTGFVHEPGLADLVELAHSHDLLFLDDLGSGTLIDTSQFGLEREPTVQDSVAAGVDVVSFSGDKLLGGPQAGIILGKADLIAHIKEYPLTRALRVDKTTIAGVQANLLHYLKGEALEKIPIWRMIGASKEAVGAWARDLLEALGSARRWCALVDGRSMIGGGSLPEESLPTALVAIDVERPDALAYALRMGRPSVVTRIEDGRVMLDLRTVLPRQQEPLIQRLGDELTA